MNYDIVNTGREALAQIITTLEHNLTAAVKALNKADAMTFGQTLLGAYTDLDNLIGCDTSFLIGPWIADAKKWANATDAPEKYYEWMVSNFRHSPSVLSGSRQPAQEPLLPVASPRSRQNSD